MKTEPSEIIFVVGILVCPVVLFLVATWLMFVVTKRFPFELSTDDSGTNFILRSYGSKRYREHYLKSSVPPIQYNISVLYPHVRTGAEARARTQTNALTVTNQTIITKETNHVHSASQ